MDMVPLRDLFDDHREDMRGRLDRIERKIDRFDDHTHKGYVTWVALLPVVVSVAAALIAFL